MGGAGNGLGLSNGQFYIELVGSGAQAVMTQEGNVGLGTTSTSAFGRNNRLNVVTGVADDRGLYVENSTSSAAAFWAQNIAGGPAAVFGGGVVPTVDALYFCGTNSQRWSLVRGVTVTSGDLTFENSYRFTEDRAGSGLLIINEDNEAIARLDHDGNLHVKGRVVENSDLGEAPPPRYTAPKEIAKAT